MFLSFKGVVFTNRIFLSLPASVFNEKKILITLFLVALLYSVVLFFWEG